MHDWSRIEEQQLRAGSLAAMAQLAGVAVKWRGQVLASLILASVVAISLPIVVRAAESCRCLENGGEPGPGDCPCNVSQCYHDCVDDLCPDTPNCTLECSFRCTCDSAPPGCPDHEDPGPTPTRAPSPTRMCVGDCDANGVVHIDELVLSVNIALGSMPISHCRRCDQDSNGQIQIAELIAAVCNALNGCP